ncbi:unnamed protein product [Orchesella dallaii]|uniref:Pro-Pol polyprotein n=1 Tax=Orchesella dallaii TaxID=48710 RepID=A0ABP1PL17_9HEXA
MDNQLKARNVWRSALARHLKTAETVLKTKPIDQDEVQVVYYNLKEVADKIIKLDAEIMDGMLVAGSSEEELDAEMQVMEQHECSLQLTRLQLEKHFKKRDPDIDEDCLSTTSRSSTSKMHHRLPKLELPKFNGDTRCWLQFWSQYQTIDNDDSIPTSHKFQYLIQCMVAGSKAKEVVDSYPISDENYPLVLSDLKDRFGREDVLVEVYIRDLLKLVLENALNNKSSVPFHSLYVRLTAQLRALGTLGVTTDKCAAILYPLVESALPDDVLTAWERYRQHKRKNYKTSEEHLERLMEFLKQEVAGKERIQLARGGFESCSEAHSKKQTRSRGPEVIATAAGLFAGSNQNEKETGCIFCGSNHNSDKCGKADKIPLGKKKQIVRRKRACFTCLQQGHGAKQCNVFTKCMCCNKKHSTVMCPELPHHHRDQRSSSEEKDEKKEDPDPAQTSSFGNQVESPEVLLQTLVVKVIGRMKTVSARALIDSGSQKSYVTESLAEEVGLHVLGSETVTHQLFGGEQSVKQHRRYKVYLQGTHGKFNCNFDVSDMPKICGPVNSIPKGSWLMELAQNQIDVSDVESGREIHVLIGADVAGKLMTGKKMELSCGPVAVETLLGWTLMGKLPRASGPQRSSMLVTSLHVNDADVSKLWDLDAIGISDPGEKKSREELEELAMKHFEDTVRRKSDGRYEVNLPWVEESARLPSNRQVTERRLENTTTKLKKDGTLQQYDDLLKQWEQLGIIEEVPASQVNFGHYIPHRAVYKANSETTPIRPVFDASCKLKGKLSLNDCMEKGPNLLERIPAVITRFRINPVGVVADIKKAFQQISVCPKDRNYMRFLWWDDLSCSSVKEYRHCRVVFGVSSSPFLLGATLNHLLDNASEVLRPTAEIMKNALYVDNVAASLNSFDEAAKFKKECDELLLPARFELRGWEFGPSEIEKNVPLLGLIWKIKEDSLGVDLTSALTKMEGPVTKRKMLSLAHTVFDPIGFVSPYAILPKILLQETWSKKLGWDAELPEDIVIKFEEWTKQLHILEALRIPRCITFGKESEDCQELHIFVDASKKAYAACAFMRVECEEGVKVNLLLAKTRVAPLKTLTIPRLELLSCTIGARLANSIREMGFINIKITYWTDSSTALYWIKNDGNWGVFVQRRVEEIRRLSNISDWRHVAGENNPADLPSRGCTAAHLVKSRWWEGPIWLKKNPEEWPLSMVEFDEAEIKQEMKKIVVSSLDLENEAWNKIVACTTYEEMLQLVSDDKGMNSTTDMQLIERELVRTVQQQHFSGPDDVRFKKLPVIKDTAGLLRVKTRLSSGDFTEDFTFPLVLPSRCEVVEALILHEHRKDCHAGVSTLMVNLRERFWILKSRRTIRNVIRKCLPCARFSAKSLTCEVPALPKERIEAVAPFQITGVDLFGPMFLRDGRKCWVALFTCAVYRAVHLELVTSLSTETFKNALRRFVARRGRPEIMYSDNGTNFVGCNNQFKEVNWNQVQKYGKFMRIDWRFNPPTAAWWGGFWERLVGVVKTSLRKVLGKAVLNKEELVTVLCDVEATVNRRPLAYVSEDPEDLKPLTPHMFLYGIPNSHVPEADVHDGASLSKRLKLLQILREDLRSRFRKEYLGQLRNVKKGKTTREPKEGDLVLIGYDNMKRIDWPVGRITQLIKGRDGNVRVVNVKTEDGTLTRPIQRIFPLEATDDKDDGDKVGETLRKEAGTRTRFGREVKAPERFPHSDK